MQNAHNQQIRRNTHLTPSAFRTATDKAKVDLYFCPYHFSALNYVNVQKEVKEKERGRKESFQKNKARWSPLIYNKEWPPHFQQVMADGIHIPIESERIAYSKVEAKAILELLDIVETRLGSLVRSMERYADIET